MGPRILIVDDNRELAENLAEILELEGLDALVMDDPRTVLESARDLRFDAALLDVRMPGIDGIDLLQELARYTPDAIYLLMTAFTREERLAERDHRVRHVLAKPFGPDALLAALRKEHLVREPA